MPITIYYYSDDCESNSGRLIYQSYDELLKDMGKLEEYRDVIFKIKLKEMEVLPNSEETQEKIDELVSAIESCPGLEALVFDDPLKVPSEFMMLSVQLETKWDQPGLVAKVRTFEPQERDFQYVMLRRMSRKLSPIFPRQSRRNNKELIARSGQKSPLGEAAISGRYLKTIGGFFDSVETKQDVHDEESTEQACPVPD